MIRHVAATATPKNGSECIIINARYRKGDRTSARVFQTWNHESSSQAIIHKWWNYRMVRRKNAFNWKCSRNWGSFVIRNFERNKKTIEKNLHFPQTQHQLFNRGFPRAYPRCGCQKEVPKCMCPISRPDGHFGTWLATELQPDFDPCRPSTTKK